MKLPRKLKKRVKQLFIYHSESPSARKLKLPINEWHKMYLQYRTWLNRFYLSDIKKVNKIHIKKIHRVLRDGDKSLIKSMYKVNILKK